MSKGLQQVVVVSVLFSVSAVLAQQQTRSRMQEFGDGKRSGSMKMRCKMLMKMEVPAYSPRAVLALAHELGLTEAQRRSIRSIAADATRQAKDVLTGEQSEKLRALEDAPASAMQMHRKMMAKMNKGDGQCPMMAMMEDDQTGNGEDGGASARPAAGKQAAGKSGGEGATAPIRQHHAKLLGELESVWAFANETDTSNLDAKRRQAAKFNDWLVAHIKPHAEREAKYLYPEVARLMGAPRATETMAIDHEYIGQYIDKLGDAMTTGSDRSWTQAELASYRARLKQLEGILVPHFAKEERVYLSLLDRELDAAAVRERIIEPIQNERRQTEKE